MFSRAPAHRTSFFGELLVTQYPPVFVERPRFGVGLSELLGLRTKLLIDNISD